MLLFLIFLLKENQDAEGLKKSTVSFFFFIERSTHLQKPQLQYHILALDFVECRPIVAKTN